jgi:hypothetical protein
LPLRRRRIDSGSLSELERYLFDIQGYLLFEDVIDQKVVARLRSTIDARGLRPAGPELESQRFGGGGELFSWDRAFADLMDAPLVLAVLREFIGRYVRLDHAYGICMSPGTSGLGLHGPWEPFDPSQFYVHRLGVARSGLLSFSWALSDGRPGQGGFGCIPGSHRASFPLPPDADSLVVEVPQPVGSLLVFSEALVHQTLPWHGSETRWVVMYKYSPANSAWDPSPAAPSAVVAGMTARQQRFFLPPSVGGRGPTLDP